MSKICPKCGKEVADKIKTCPACGAPIDEKPVAEKKADDVAPVVPEVVETPIINDKVNFYKHIKKFKGVHVFFLYFFKLIALIGILAILAAPLAVPYLRVDPYQNVPGLFEFDFKFTNMTSIAMIVLDIVKNGTFTSHLDVIFALVIYVLFLLPAIIWWVIKFIRCFILLIFSCTKKKMVVIEMLAKTQKREYDFGMLNIDKLFFYSLFVSALIYFTTITGDLFGEIKLLHTFDCFRAHPMMNFGSFAVWAGAGVGFILCLIYLLVRRIVRGKVKKHFGLGKKKKAK